MKRLMLVLLFSAVVAVATPLNPMADPALFFLQAPPCFTFETRFWSQLEWQMQPFSPYYDWWVAFFSSPLQYAAPGSYVIGGGFCGSQVPEPAGMAIGGLLLLGVAVFRRSGKEGR